ncbi:MAG: ZIP family metal transporter [Rhodocyclaceae bacterium]|nr:ZIP family metal transporter [Rhodocyclaceae bacterium]
MNPFVQVIAASVLAGFASMGIAFSATSRLSQVWLTRLISFAAGLMLALALLDLLPEALESGLDARVMFGVLLAGLMALFAIDFNLHAGCHHGDEGLCAHDLARPIPMILVGGALHVFTDGLMLGAAFLVDPALAWGMTVAVLAHEVPREAGDFALLLTAKWGRSRALAWNALSRLACVVGAVAGFLTLSGAREWVPYILTVAAANFIYIALTGILPWLRHERGAFAWQGGFMAAGIALVPLWAKLVH